MARTGMANLITQVRSIANAGTADFSINGVDYWSDDQIQEELDRTRMSIRGETIMGEPEYIDGITRWYDYNFDHGDVEEGTAYFVVRNSEGSAMGTADYSVDYEARVVSFTNDTSGSAYSLHYRYYDVYWAAARLWEKKAGYVADGFDIASDNHDMSRSQIFAQYMKMAQYLYTKRLAGKVMKMKRVDAK